MNEIAQFLVSDKQLLLLPEQDLILNKLSNNTVYCATFSECHYIKSHMFSGTSQRLTENYIENMGYHIAVNNLPKNIRKSIKKYTTDPDEKYDPTVYTNIRNAIEQMRPLDVELVLFRGQNDDIDPQWWITTTTSYQIAIDQFTEEVDCCLLVLKVQPGVKILPVYEFEENHHADEQEIIIQSDGVLKFLREDQLGRMTTFIYQYDPPTPIKVVDNEYLKREEQKDLLTMELQELGLL